MLWDYTKCKKTKDETIQRPKRTGDDRSKCGDRSKTASHYEETTANSAHAGISQTVGHSFTTALAVQNVRTGRRPAATRLGRFTEIELSDNIASIE